MSEQYETMIKNSLARFQKTKMQLGLLLVACDMTVVARLVYGHWVLNKLIGISICIAFVVIFTNTYGMHFLGTLAYWLGVCTSCRFLDPLTSASSTLSESGQCSTRNSATKTPNCKVTSTYDYIQNTNQPSYQSTEDMKMSNRNAQ
ncbi:hypothetical protein YC2023_095479 [Brassica napus]